VVRRCVLVIETNAATTLAARGAQESDVAFLGSPHHGIERGTVGAEALQCPRRREQLECRPLGSLPCAQRLARRARNRVIRQVDAQEDAHVAELGGGKHLPRRIKIADMAAIEAHCITRVADRITAVAARHEDLLTIVLQKLGPFGRRIVEGMGRVGIAAANSDT